VALQEHHIPAARQRFIEAKESQWKVEAARLQFKDSTSGKNVDEAKHQVSTAERNVTKLEEAVRICQAHLNALECGDIGMLSAMLEARLLDAIEEAASVADGAQSQGRVTYMCKEMPPGATADSFAAAFGVPVEHLRIFQESVPGASSPKQPTDPSRPRALRTMVYFPTVIPKPNIVEADLAVQSEIDDYERTFPTFPPNTELLEQLAALRRGDCITLSTMLSNQRKKLLALSSEREAEQMRRKIVELQQEIHIEHRRAESALAALRAAEEALEKNTKQFHAAIDEAAEQRKRCASLEATIAELRETRRLNAESEIGHIEAIHCAEMNKKDEERRVLLQRVAVLESELQTRSAVSENALDHEKESVKSILVKWQQLEGVRTDLEKQNEGLMQQLSVLQNDRAALRAALEEAQKHLVTADAELRAAQMRQSAVEQQQRSTREVYVAKPVPRGVSVREFCDQLGIEVDRQRIVEDATTKQYYVYVPLRVPFANIASEDEAVQALLREVAPEKSSARSSPPRSDPFAAVNILDHLAALRSGDAGALSAMLRDLRKALIEQQETSRNLSRELAQKGLEIDEMLRRGTFGRPITPLEEEVGSAGDIDNENDDLNWTAATVGKKKITMLREALKAVEAERDQWQQVCEDYRRHETLDFAALEEAKRNLEEKESSSRRLLEIREKELEELRAKLHETDERARAGAQQAEELRKKRQEEHRVIVQELDGRLSEESAKRRAAEVKVAERDAVIVELKHALEECGVEVDGV
jgi:chromosome segregation ATPase